MVNKMMPNIAYSVPIVGLQMGGLLTLNILNCFKVY